MRKVWIGAGSLFVVTRLALAAPAATDPTGAAAAGPADPAAPDATEGRRLLPIDPGFSVPTPFTLLEGQEVARTLPLRDLAAHVVGYTSDGARMLAIDPDGAVLLDEDPTAAQGRVTLEGRMLAGIGVTPLGLARPPAWDLVYRHGVVRGDQTFGRTRLLRCPHFLADGRCGIWKHREGVCATWYCRHERGAVGFDFWEALGGFLHVIERALSYDAVLALGVDGAALRRLVDGPAAADGPALDGRSSPAAQRATCTLSTKTRPSMVTTGSCPSGTSSLNLPGPPRRAASSAPVMRSSSHATPAARSATRIGKPRAARLK